MTGWTVLGIVVVLAAIWVAVVIAKAVVMHFALKKQLKAEGVQFAEKADRSGKK